MTKDQAKIVNDAVRILPQSQASLQDQLDMLSIAAIKLGLYDAADWMKAKEAEYSAYTEAEQQEWAHEHGLDI